LKSLDCSRSFWRAGDAVDRSLLWKSIALICVAMSTTVLEARTHRSQTWAETQFAKAESQRETLNGQAEQSRTRRQYEGVIASYRRVVLEAPTSSKADASAFAVAEVTAEMGRHFKNDMALYSAIREYKFLRREYPGSKHRIEALLAIGEIYKNDIADQSEAQAAFQELLQRYPHSRLAEEAKAELQGSTQSASTLDAVKNPVAKATNSTEDKGTDSESNSRPAAEPSKAQQTADEKTVRVKAVQPWSAPDYTRITVDLEQDVEFQSQRLSDPDRVFFDLKNARLPSDLRGKTLDVDDGLVKKIRMAQYKPGRARIVVETEDQASYNASLLLNPPRLIIDIHSAHPEQDVTTSESKISTAPASASTDDTKPAKATPTVVPTATKTPAETLPKKVIVEADDDDPSDTNATSAQSAKKSSRPAAQLRVAKSRVAAEKEAREAQPTADGDRSLIRALGLKIGKIVIDPGHGGHDTGTIGPNGLLEKDLVLDVGKRLSKLLESRMGAEVVFTRNDDTFIPLETRTSIANQEQADLFVSIHANSSHDPDARGVETYYLNFTSSPEALEVAARENAASDKSIHELQDLVKKIALKEKIEESREFASDVQQSLHSGLAVKNAGIRDRGVKKAPFVVLIGANMPSILAEISFISNPGDEKRLKGPEYRQRIALSLYSGISRYVNGLGGVKVATKIDKAAVN
jgi:N-acetylmuramoyl-L-alanine amidase